MKSLPEETFLIDLIHLVAEHTKSKHGISPNVDAFNIASKLRDRFDEYVEQNALENIICRCQIEKLTDKNNLFLRKTITKILRENAELKSKNDYLLINPA